MSEARNYRMLSKVLGVPMVLAVSWASLSGCGGPAATTASSGAAGTTAPSTVSGSKGFQIGANQGPGGTLYLNDLAKAGELPISGLVVVEDPHNLPTLNPPADTVVTLDGVQLVHAIIGGTPAPHYFTFDPAGPQPTVASDGFLHITASSAGAGAERVLNLACPPAIAVTLSPAPGSSLSGVSTVRLDWASGALPVQGRDLSAFGLTAPSVSLLGFDAATHVMSPTGSSLSLAPDATGVTLPVVSTTASGYVVELRYPGVFFIDGETGGACGRTQRFVYAK
jgi:hypothetical protein